MAGAVDRKVTAEVFQGPSSSRTALQLFGLSGIAIAQPLFSLLGDNPTYFVAHGMDGLDLVLFAMLVLVVPAAAFTALVVLIGAVSRTAGAVAMAMLVGLLVTLAMFSALDSVDNSGPIAFTLALELGTAIVAVGYLLLAPVRTFVTFLGPAPLLFAALFLFTSPASALVRNAEPAPLSVVVASDSSVVMLLFDELPLGALLDSRGQIDRGRFPNFARLADASTWYPNTTTVSPWTHMAVPAILTGSLPDQRKAPVAGQYPRSLFTMLGGSRRLEVQEKMTSLCSESLCGSRPTVSRPGTLATDTGLVTLHQLLPQSLANRLLPSISGRWAGFAGGQEATSLPTDSATLSKDAWEALVAPRRWQYEGNFPKFVSSISPGSGPTLWYSHEMFPHMPYRFLPDGTTYDLTDRVPGGLSADWMDWVSDPNAVVTPVQRLMLQLQYTDRLLGRVLDALEQTRLFDDTLVLVLSDHGITFEGDTSRRGDVSISDDGERRPLEIDELAGGIADEMMPVPLFIKYPGQTEGAIDDRRAQTIDVLPTIADALRIALPEDWQFRGSSLAQDPPQDPEPRDWVVGAVAETYEYQPDAMRVARKLHGVVGEAGGPHDLYAIGPAGQLVGQMVEGRIGSAADGALRNANVGDFDDIDLTTSFRPALFTGEAVDIAVGSWIAVALNGTVAGLGPVFVGRDDVVQVEAMLDPRLMVNGRNEVDVFLVGDDNGTLHPLIAE